MIFTCLADLLVGVGHSSSLWGSGARIWLLQWPSSYRKL